MMNPQPIRQELDDLADRMDRLHLAQPAARLRALGAAVGDGTDADLWAEADLRAIFDVEDIAAQIPKGRDGERSLEILEGARNFLVLVPIVVTMYGIWRAGEAYHDLLEAREDLRPYSFLYLWQRGFEGRSFTLSRVAMIDVMLLSLVILIAVVAYIRSISLRDEWAQQVASLRRDLSQALGDAALVLIARRPKPGNLLVTFQAAVGDLRALSARHLQLVDQEHTRLRELATQRANDLEQLGRFTDKLDTTLSTFATKIDGSLGAFTRDFGATTTAFVADFGAKTTALGQTLDSGITRMERGLGAAAQRVADATTALDNALTPLGTAMQDFATAQHDLATHAGETSARLGVIVTLQEGASRMQAEHGMRLESAAALLESANLRLSDDATSLAEYARALARDLAAFLGEVAAERAQQAALAVEVRDATQHVADSTGAMRALAQTLHASSVDLSDLLRLLPELPNLGALLRRTQADAELLEDLARQLQERLAVAVGSP